jgi:hypothetical protein
MLIAKSYYGKKAKHGIERLAEGKYRIAGKIVFVRVRPLLHTHTERVTTGSILVTLYFFFVFIN